MNWYAIQTVKGQEEYVKAEAESFIPDVKFMLLLRMGKYKYRGEWVEEPRPMFPGYFFAVTDDPYTVRSKLKKVFRFCKIVGFDGALIPISYDERVFLESLIDEDGVTGMSYGVIEGDQIIVFEGPMKGLESRIVKIDRKKRLAYLKVEMGNTSTEMQIGLEVVRKTP